MSEPKKPTPNPQVSRSTRVVADDHQHIRKDYVAGANGDEDVDASAAAPGDEAHSHHSEKPKTLDEKRTTKD